MASLSLSLSLSLTIPFDPGSVARNAMETPPASYESCITFDDGAGSSPKSVVFLPSPSFETLRDHILREIQQLVNRYNECFLCLHDAIADLDLLRSENLHLTAENLELAFLIDEFGSATVRSDTPAESPPLASPGAIPKSISIRSPGFLTVKHPPPGAAAGGSGRSHRLRLPASSGHQEEGGSGAGAVEVDVYEQGTAKTELCNKWGETGKCPYGERCRFAHGIQELRPVIRHPRYKTQLCRMMRNCPYGHRCHFRHAAMPEV